MSAERATYLDASALVKLVVRERESSALQRYLRRRRPLVSSALARTEVARALLPLGKEAVERQLGADLGQIVTYDHRMASAAESLGFTVTAPK